MSVGLPILIWVVAVTATLWGTWRALRAKRPSLPAVYPPVSILKPLKGVDPGFDENVGSFFVQDYPRYEILFSVADAGDPAVAAVRRLMAKYPGVPTRLLIGARDLGPNPKVNNLAEAYDHAANDCLLISDSNVRVSPDYLRRVVANLTPGVGVVTAVVAGQHPSGIGGKLEATYLNSFYARWMHVSEGLGQACVVGKQMLFRRSVMDRFGGLHNLGKYIAEDYMAGQAMKRLGLRVVVMRDAIDQYIGEHSLSSFWSRHVRWGRIRKAQAPLAFVFEPLLGAIVSGCIGAVGFYRLCGLDPAIFLVLHLFVWLLADCVLMRDVAQRLSPGAVLTWCLRELLAVPMWIHVASGNSVNWRGHRLRIRTGGLVEVK